MSRPFSFRPFRPAPRSHDSDAVVRALACRFLESERWPDQSAYWMFCYKAQRPYVHLNPATGEIRLDMGTVRWPMPTKATLDLAVRLCARIRQEPRGRFVFQHWDASVAIEGLREMAWRVFEVADDARPSEG